MRRALLRDVATASEPVAVHRALGAEAVHETRKRIKRCRAVLRLLRPALDDGDFAACDRALRRAGKALSRARDAAVASRLQAELGSLAAGRRKAPSRGPGPAGPMASAADVARAHRSLQSAADSLALAKLHRRGWSTLGPGVRTVYRGGRRRVPVEAQAASGAALHDWRRHVKRYWHVLEVFSALNPERLGAVIGIARRLSDVLGEEHDLAMLDARLRARRDPPDDVLRLVAERRAKLTRRAVTLGTKLYREPSKTIERELHRDWDRWRERARTSALG
ncbi:MAG TPA: CHAD domain-containing protein [Steroidobacteraceae bacterium]|nr:CHAD domain-containing protein [Steroidobacteraceae bacterium]